MKRILAVSHCILNTAAKVAQDERALAAEYAARKQLLQLVLARDIQLIQLPCPEFLLYGSQRWGHVSEQFDHPHYRMQCRELLRPVVAQLEEYNAHPEDFELLGIVAVEGSPSCGYHETCTAPWKGELDSDPEVLQQLLSSLSLKTGPGVMMRILEQELKQAALNLPILSIGEAVERLSAVPGDR